MKTQMSRIERPPTHPGAVLREDVIPALGETKVAIADHLGISRQQLYGLLDEKRPVSPNIAVRLGKLCGNGPGLWLRMQAAYDLWHAELELDSEITNIPTLMVRDMRGAMARPSGRTVSTGSKTQLVRQASTAARMKRPERTSAATSRNVAAKKVRKKATPKFTGRKR
jgi:addiction module HigA family antidote